MAHIVFEGCKVFYTVAGSGQPVLLLHGNSVSSKLFSPVWKQYRREYKVVTFDFPGHGKSSREEEFETDFWYYNSRVAATLLDHLGLKQVNVVGTSGGALVGINLALERPDLVNYLFADSFEGAYPLDSFIKTLKQDRARDKKKLLAKLYWWNCHGWDWKKVVDRDTQMNIEFAKTGRSFFHKDIAELRVPCLLTGSRKDEYCNDLEQIYCKLKEENPKLEIHMFNEGNHPAMLSNKEAFLELLKLKIK